MVFPSRRGQKTLGLKSIHSALSNQATIVDLFIWELYNPCFSNLIQTIRYWGESAQKIETIGVCPKFMIGGKRCLRKSWELSSQFFNALYWLPREIETLMKVSDMSRSWSNGKLSHNWAGLPGSRIPRADGRQQWNLMVRYPCWRTFDINESSRFHFHFVKVLVGVNIRWLLARSIWRCVDARTCIKIRQRSRHLYSDTLDNAWHETGTGGGKISESEGRWGQSSQWR
jgi:hypothetical protein